MEAIDIFQKHKQEFADHNERVKVTLAQRDAMERANLASYNETVETLRKQLNDKSKEALALQSKLTRLENSAVTTKAMHDLDVQKLSHRMQALQSDVDTAQSDRLQAIDKLQAARVERDAALQDVATRDDVIRDLQVSIDKLRTGLIERDAHIAQLLNG